MKAALWTVLLAVIGGAAAIWAVGPLRGVEGPLELLAFSATGRFGTEARLDADSAARLRFPLILGVNNLGSKEVTVESVHVSLPARFRLVHPSGSTLSFVRDDGGPLARYAFAGGAEPIEPGTLPAVVPGADQLFIEPLFGGLQCMIDPLGLPTLAPAPPYDAASLARIDAFWSLTSESGRRHTGVLQLTLDVAAIARRTSVLSLQAGPITVSDSAASTATTVALEGTGEVPCGEPGFSERITAASWWLAGNGRMITLAVRDTPRLVLYDRDADGTIEREARDTDGDGRFETTRDVGYPIPPFLLPSVAAPAPAPAVPDTLAADSTAVDSVAAPARTDTIVRGGR